MARSKIEQQQRDFYLVWGQAPVGTVLCHLEFVFFVPPDRLAGKGQDDQVAHSVEKALR